MKRRLLRLWNQLIRIEGRILDLNLTVLGGYKVALWLGREEADQVKFSLEVALNYYERPTLEVRLELGVLLLSLYLHQS